MLAIIFLCIIKSYLFAMFVWTFTTSSLSIAEILLKRWSKIAVANIANNACVMLTYARRYWRQRTVRQRLRNFCINKNKMVA